MGYLLWRARIDPHELGRTWRVSSAPPMYRAARAGAGACQRRHIVHIARRAGERSHTVAAFRKLSMGLARSGF